MKATNEQEAAAIKALKDHIESLEPGQREKALEFQHMLETQSASHPDGMIGVIADHTKRLQGELLQACIEIRETALEEVSTAAAQVIVDRARYSK